MDVLINLLDDDSFQRLYDFNPEFRGNSQVEARKNGSQLTISETLEAVERKFINVLSFADKLLEAQQLSPLERLNGEL